MKRRAFIAGIGAAAAAQALPTPVNATVPFNEANLTAAIEAGEFARFDGMVFWITARKTSTTLDIAPELRQS